MEQTPADICRTLIRTCDRATLATAMADDGTPYASLVLTATDHGARPLLLLSDLADHTKNLNADPAASLLFDGTAGLANPLTGARVTVQGRLQKVDTPDLRARFVARHPSAAVYSGFKDFNLYRMSVTKAHLVAGFGRIHWVDGGAVVFGTDGKKALADAETDIVDHMNSDHSDAVGLFANVLLDKPGAGWRMTGIDPEGVDLRLGGTVGRLGFHTPVRDAQEARRELVRLTKAARGAAQEK